MDSHGQRDFLNTLEFPPKKKPEHMRSAEWYLIAKLPY